MRKILVFLALAATGLVYAEPQFQSVSATNSAQYVVLSKAAQSVLICNDAASANIAYFRLFEEGDAPGAAVATSSPLAIGACKSFGEPDWGKRFVSLSILSAGTSTVTIDSK